MEVLIKINYFGEEFEVFSIPLFNKLQNIGRFSSQGFINESLTWQRGVQTSPRAQAKEII